MGKVVNILKKKYVYWPIIIIAVIVALVLWNSATGVQNYADKYAGFDFSKVEGEGREDSYTAYLIRHGGANAVYPAETISIPLTQDSISDGENYKFIDYGGEKGVLASYEGGFVEFKVNIKQAGFYNINLTYYPDQEDETSRGIEIERALYINGQIPFSGADAITFDRIFQNDGESTYDNQGNEIRPSQIEAPRWEKTYLCDELGYIVAPYCFYFEEGENTIRLDAKQETLILKDFQISERLSTPDYDAYISGANTSLSDNKWHVKIQGESADYRSSQSLYATYDRTSASTTPYSVTKQLLNMIGGNNWKVAGQWIEWKVDVPEDGYYELTFKTRQNYNRGFVSCRSLYINGEVPFEEVSAIKFDFSNDWKLITLSDSKNKPYKFHLNKGENLIRMEVTLGEIGDILNRMNDSVFRLNRIYRKILVLTGTEPDENRDYNIDEKYPDVITGMADEAKVLYKIIDDLIEYTGETGTQVTSSLTLANQLERFGKDPDNITAGLANFKDNVSALGSSILSLSQSNLDIDYLIVSGSDYKVPDDSPSWFDNVLHEVKAFVSTFTVDYNAIGNVYGDDMDTITVWIFAGRDQSTILKTMIDDTFVEKYGVGVNVDLITADVLLPATVAGTGPDVALNAGSGEPVNYALRGAATDLTQFKGNGSDIRGFDEVISEFKASSFVPYTYAGGVYALPETQYYNVMFYRTDIFEELGIDIPQTWDDLIAILPTIQKSNMSVGIPSTERKINNVSNPDMSGFFAQYYQMGASLYNEEGSATLLDSEEAVKAFERFTMFFTHYKCPKDYNFIDRFRTGEMPLGFVDYNNYNTLVVSAPEIRGLWEMAPIPGNYILDENGNRVDKDGDGKWDIDRSVSCWGTCSMLLGTSKHKDAAWTFLQWWASAEVQARYGRELEAVMGESARYATANVNAFDQLSWSTSERAVLEEQWNWVVGTPEVPGGYYTSRHIVNAVRKVINANEDPRETLLDYNRDINDEIAKKRAEFGLSSKVK